MPSTTLRWVSDLQFVGTDSSNHSVVFSANDPATGSKPSEMLLLALSACSSADVVEILKKKRTPPASLVVQADGEHDKKAPWAFRKIHLTYRVKGKNLTEKGVAQAIQLSQEKYCSVAATVRGVAEITTSYEILPDE